jgi:hypothetical protein
MRYQHLFKEIARLAGLHFTHDIRVEYSDERRKGLLIMVDAGIFLGGSQVNKLDYKPWPEMAEGQALSLREKECFHPLDKSITDMLGDYFPSDRKIVIYKKVCETTAELLGVGYGALEYVVALHEITHAVTHLGEEGFPGSGIIWDFFPDADLWDRELFAQIYPLFHFQQRDEQGALDVFLKLSMNQHAIYNSWQVYQYFPLTEINELLSLTRLKRFCVWVDLDSSVPIPSPDP